MSEVSGSPALTSSLSDVRAEATVSNAYPFARVYDEWQTSWAQFGWRIASVTYCSVRGRSLSVWVHAASVTTAATTGRNMARTILQRAEICVWLRPLDMRVSAQCDLAHAAGPDRRSVRPRYFVERARARRSVEPAPL